MEPTGSSRYPPYLLRFLGALALLGVGAVHIDQYFDVHYDVVPVIGTLFVLNLAGAAAIALLLILPTERFLGDAGPVAIGLLALAGIGLALTSGAFLLVSEHTPLFGFMENGYRTAIVLSFIAEGATVILLGSYLVALVARGGSQAPARSFT
jgi:hypothetical protein